MANNNLKDIEVLIVDDHKLIQHLVHRILTTWGFKAITVANSGRQAIELVKQKSFDLIISDWRMGDLDGIDLLRYVRTSPDSLDPDIPIILLTGNAELSDITAARDAGVSEYLIKPFSAEDLIARIRAVIERPRSFILAPNYHGPDRRRTLPHRPIMNERRKRGET